MVSGSGHDPDVTARSSPPDRPRPTVVELDLIVEVLVCAHRRGGDLFVLLRRYGGQGEQAQPCCGDHVRPKLTRDTSGREAGGPQRRALHATSHRADLRPRCRLSPVGADHPIGVS
jgi:hypothetical protein